MILLCAVIPATLLLCTYGCVGNPLHGFVIYFVEFLNKREIIIDVDQDIQDGLAPYAPVGSNILAVLLLEFTRRRCRVFLVGMLFELWVCVGFQAPDFRPQDLFAPEGQTLLSLALLIYLEQGLSPRINYLNRGHI